MAAAVAVGLAEGYVRLSPPPSFDGGLNLLWVSYRDDPDLGYAIGEGERTVPVRRSPAMAR